MHHSMARRRIYRAPRLTDYASLGLARIALVQGDAEGARQILERVTSTARQFGPAFRLLATPTPNSVARRTRELAMGRANMLPVFTPYADPLIDALARESRNSTFLLQQAAEADLAANADWDEYLIRRALEFDPDNPDVVYKLGLILRAKQRNDESARAVSAVSANGARGCSGRRTDWELSR